MRFDPLKSDCNALAKVGKDLTRTLGEPGACDIGYKIVYDPKTGEPVLWLWQSFTVIRVGLKQMPELVARCTALMHQHQIDPRPPRSGYRLWKKRRRKGKE